jgi:hypothetical protein
MLPFIETSCGGLALLSSFLFSPSLPTYKKEKESGSRCNGNGDII